MVVMYSAKRGTRQGWVLAAPLPLQLLVVHPVECAPVVDVRVGQQLVQAVEVVVVRIALLELIAALPWSDTRYCRGS